MKKKRIGEKSLNGFAVWLRENEKSAAAKAPFADRNKTKK